MAAKPPAVDRETLYREVWTSPVTDVAPRYGLSDVGLVKICHKLAIPVPSRGYWAKVRAGRLMKIPPLPVQKENAREDTGLRPLDEEQIATRALVKSAVDTVRESRRKVSTSPDNPLSETVREAHPLLQATAARLRRNGGWDEETRIRCAPKEVLDLAVTGESLERAIELMTTLLDALQPLGFDVRVNKSAGKTELIQNGTILSLRMWEKIDRKPHVVTAAEQRKQDQYYSASHRGPRLDYPHIPQFDYVPTGRLTITVGGWGGRNWNDTLRSRLESRIDEVVGGIVACMEKHRIELAEEARKKALYEEARDRYESEVRRRQEERGKLSQLRRDAARHWRAMRLREYIAAFEARAHESGPLSPEARDWIAWARAKADWIDPLTDVTDPILDAPEPKPPNYWSWL